MFFLKPRTVNNQRQLKGECFQFQIPSQQEKMNVSNTTSSLGSYKLAATELYRYLFPLILLLGTTGNCLSMLVLRRSSMRRRCSSVYLTSLAAVDTVVLYVSGFKTWVRLQTSFELMHVSDVICRLVKYSFFVSTHLAAWIVVAVTVERFIIVGECCRVQTGSSVVEYKLMAYS